MKRMITAYREGMELSGITEAFSGLSVETASCDIRDIKKALRDFDAEAVFTVGFDKNTADLCHEEELPYISWVLTSPAPELFVPQILYPLNRIFIADHNLYRILISSGVQNVFFETVGFTDKRDLRILENGMKRTGKASDIREQIFFLLDEDEKKFLLGLKRAQELYHVKNLFFYGLGTDLIDKIYSGLRLDPEKDPVYRRYFVAECLLRQMVKEKEALKISGCGEGSKKRIFCFDDTGLKSLNAMLGGYTVCSDGCGLSVLELKRDSDYIYYEDPADLAIKLEAGLPQSTARKKIQELSVKNVIRKMIFS